MNSVLRKFIRFELHMYHINKTNLENINYQALISFRHLAYLNLLIQGIESALESLPDEVEKYVQARYFKKNYCNNAGWALKLNVSERTIAYWDSMVLKTIAINIGLINSTDKIA